MFLMGLCALPELTRRLIESGLPPETPAAVLSGGNSPHPADVRGTLEDIAGRAAQVEAPAVIIIGEVAAVRLGGPGLSLSGLRVGLTVRPSCRKSYARSLKPRVRGYFPRRAPV